MIRSTSRSSASSTLASGTALTARVAQPSTLRNWVIEECTAEGQNYRRPVLGIGASCEGVEARTLTSHSAALYTSHGCTNDDTQLICLH